MSIDAGSVRFESELDFGRLDQQIEYLQRRLRAVKFEIPVSSIGVATSKITELNKSTIVPKVDHRPLTELNRHLDKKKKHWDDLNNHFAKHPLHPKTGSGGQALAVPKSVPSKQIKEQYKLFQSPQKDLQVKTKDTDSLVKAFDQKIKDESRIKQSFVQKDSENTNKLTEAVAGFSQAVEQFQKANKRTLLGSLLRGAMSMVGQNLAQLLIYRVSESISKGMAQYTQKMIGRDGGSKEEQYIIQKIIQESFRDAMEGMAKPEELQKFIAGSYIISSSVEELTRMLATQDGVVGNLAKDTNQKLERFNSGLYEILKELTIGELIHGTLRQMLKILGKGVGFGLVRVIGAAVATAITAPAKMVAGALQKTGADKASLTTTPFTKMMEKVLGGGKSPDDMRNEALDRGFLVAALIKSFKDAPKLASSAFFSSVGKDWGRIMAKLNIQIKALQMIAPANVKRFSDPLLGMLSKMTEKNDKPGAISKGIGAVADFVKKVQDKIDEIETNVAEKITGLSKEELKQQIELDEPVTVEDFLKRIYQTLQEIKSFIVSNKVTLSTTQLAQSNIQPIEPIDPQQLYKALLPLINRLRLQGGRIVGGQKEQRGDGGFKLLANQFPDLGLEFKDELGKNKRVSNLKSDLQGIVDQLIETEQFDRLNEIAEFMVRNWEQLAREEHKNYAPSIDGGMTETRLKNNPTQENIDENWNITGDSIVEELHKLVRASKQAGYKVQQNISEGSPGITKKIRGHWLKTIDYVIRQMMKLVAPSKVIGEKIKEGLEGAFNSLDNVFQGLVNKFKGFDLKAITEQGSNIAENIKTKITVETDDDSESGIQNKLLGKFDNIKSNLEEQISSINFKDIFDISPITTIIKDIGDSIVQELLAVKQNILNEISQLGDKFNLAKDGEKELQTLSSNIVGSIQQLGDYAKESLSNINVGNGLNIFVNTFQAINQNIESSVVQLNQLTKLTDLTPHLNALEKGIKSLRFKLLFNSVKAVKQITKYLDFNIDFNDGWKKNLVKFFTRGLYVLIKTSLRELGIALGQIISYVAKDISQLFQNVYNSNTFAPIREDIESFVGQMRDVFEYFQKQISKITGLFGGGKTKATVGTATVSPESVVTPEKEQIYFQRLFKTLEQSLQQLNKQGRKQVASKAGVDYSPTLTGDDILKVLIDKVEFNPSALKEVITEIETNWEDIKLDNAGWGNPFAELQDDIDLIDSKWGHTGNHFNHVLKGMEGRAKQARKSITTSLADKSPGLTQDVRDRWKYTTKDVGQSMATMANQGENTFQRLSDALRGVKITGEEVSDSLITNLQNKLGNVANNLIDRGEIQFYELLGVNLKDTSDIDKLVDTAKSRIEKLNEIQLNDVNNILSDFSGVLNKRENIAFNEVRNNLKEINDVKKEISQRLNTPPKLVDDKGDIDKRAVIKYLSEVETLIKRYELLLGNITQKIKFNPNVEKALKSLPLESRRNFNLFVNSASSGLQDLEQLATLFKGEMQEILNLDSDSLRQLGLPESFISQVDKLVEKGQQFRSSLDFQDFKLPTFDDIGTQAERTLVNIYDKTAQVQELQTDRQANKTRESAIIGDISQVKSKFEKDYAQLVAQGKQLEAKHLKDSYQSYIKERSNQLKQIKQVERQYAKELADVAVALGEFNSESEVASYLKGFDNLGEGLDNLVDLIQSSNNELKSSVIDMANSLSGQLKEYENAEKAIAKIQNQSIKTSQRKQQIEKKFEGEINKAREKGNLKEMVKLEQQRAVQLMNVGQEQDQLNQQLATQNQLQEQLKRSIFDTQQSGSFADINAVYETEQPILPDTETEKPKLTFFEKIKATLAGIPQLAKSAFDSMAKGFDNLKTRFPILQSLEDGFKKFGLSIVGLAIAVPLAFGAISKIIRSSVQFIVNQIQQISSASFRAAVDFEAMQAQFKFVYGEATGAGALANFEKQTNELGQSFEKMTKKFVQFRMGLATVGMESMAEVMVADVQKALTVREASVDEGERALNALNQIASKGRLQLDDLNQLRSALPGTLAIAASAMNVSSAELMTMISRGQVSADEFLPKFTSALGREADPALDLALDTTLTKLNQLDNRLTELKRTLGEGSLQVARPLIDALNVGMKFIVDYADKIALISVSIGLNFFTPFAVSALKVLPAIGRNIAQFASDAVMAFRSVQLNFLSGVTTLDASQQAFFMKLKANIIKAKVLILGAIKTVIKALGPIVLIAGAIELGRGILDFNKEANAMAEKVERRYNNILKTLREIQQVDLSPQDKQNQDLEQRKRTDELGTGNFVFDALDGVKRFLNTITFTSDQQAGNTISARAYEKEFIKMSEAFRNLMASGSQIDNIVNAQGGQDDFISRKADLDNEIKITSATIRGLQTVGSPEAREQIEILRQLNQERQQELNQLQETFFPEGDYETQIQQLENFLATIRQKVDEGLDPQGFYSRQIPLVESEIQNLEQRAKGMVDALREATHAMANLGRELTRVSVASESQKFDNDLAVSGLRTQALTTQLGQDVPQGINSQITMAQIEVASSNAELARLQQESKALADTIASTDDQAIVTNLLTFFDGIGFAASSLNDLSYEALLTAETYKDLDENQQEVIKALKRSKELNIQTAQAGEQTLQSQINLKTLQRDRAIQIRDFNRSIEDLNVSITEFFRQRTRAVEDLQSQLQDVAIQNRRSARDLLEQYQDLFKTINDQLRTASNEFANIQRDIQRQTATNNLRSQLKFGGGGIFNDLIDLFDSLVASDNEYKDSVVGIEEQRLQQNREILNIARQIRALNEQAFDFETQRTRQLRDLMRQQEDFVTQQVQSWRSIRRQVEDMEQRAKEMGVAFQGIGQSLDGINKSYAQIHNAISQFAQDIQNSASFASTSGGGNPSSQGITAKGLKEYATNVVFPLANRDVMDFDPRQGFNALRKGGRRHHGNDYAAPTGTPLFAPFEGKVTSVYSDKGEWGFRLTSIDGKIEAALNHLHRIDVKQGDMVSVGQTVGTVGGAKGSWGSTGPHLDFKIRVNNKPVPVEDFYKNPTKYFTPTNQSGVQLNNSTNAVSNITNQTSNRSVPASTNRQSTNTPDPVQVARQRMNQANAELEQFQANAKRLGMGNNSASRIQALRSNVDRTIDEYYLTLMRTRSKDLKGHLENNPTVEGKIGVWKGWQENLSSLEERYKKERRRNPNEAVTRGFQVYKRELLKEIEDLENLLNQRGFNLPVNEVLVASSDLSGLGLNFGVSQSQEIAQARPNTNILRDKYQPFNDLAGRLPQYDSRFDPSTPEGRALMALTLGIGATETHGAGWSGDKMFTGRGGTGNSMVGFAQFNEKYHRNNIKTPQQYTQFLGNQLTGQSNLPNSRPAKNFAAELARLVEDGAIRTGQDLINFMKQGGNAGLGGSNWQGVDDGWGRVPGVADDLVNWLRSNGSNTSGTATTTTERSNVPSLQPVTAPDLMPSVNAMIRGNPLTALTPQTTKDIGNSVGSVISRELQSKQVDFTNVDEILNVLKTNNMVSQEELSRLLYFKDTNQIDQINVDLEFLGVDLESMFARLNEARAAQGEANRQRQQLDNERQTKQVFETARNAIEQLTQSFTSLTVEINNAVANAKGFLTYSEELNHAVQEVERQFNDLERQSIQLLRDYNQLFDFDNPQDMIAQLQQKASELQDDPNKSTITNTLVEYLQENLPKLSDGLIDLQQLKQGFTDKIVTQLSDARDVAVESVFDSTNLTQLIDKQNQQINALRMVGESISQFGSITQGTELLIAAEELEIGNKYLQLIEDLRIAKAKLGDTEEDVAKLTRLNQLEQIAREQELIELSEVRNRRLKETESQIQSTLAQSLRFVGEGLRQDRPLGGGTEYLIKAEEIDIMSRYNAEFERLDALLKANQDNPQLLENIRQLKHDLENLQVAELENVRIKVNAIAQAIQQPLQDAFSSIISDVIMGTKGLGEVFGNFLQQMSNFFAQIASQMITSSVMRWFGGIGLFGSGGSVGNFSGGGLIGNYNDGGDIPPDAIPNFSSGGELLALGHAVKQAMGREGAGAVPIVAHVGEQVLTTRNGDAQAFRKLEQSGKWNLIKNNLDLLQPFNESNALKSYINIANNTNPMDKLPSLARLEKFKKVKAVGNYFAGGPVGLRSRLNYRNQTYTPNFKLANNDFAMGRGGTQPSFATTINVTTPDANSFRKSQSLIAQEQRLQQERVKRFT